MSLYADKPEKRKAIIWTTAVHAALFLLFILISYSIPASTPPEDDLGMEVNLGTSDNGSGTEQPMDVEDPAPANAAAASRSVATTKSEVKEMMRSDDADAPVVSNTKKANSRNNTETNSKRPSRNTQQQAANTTNTAPQRARYVYSGGTGRGGNSAAANGPGTNEGNTTGNGDRGVPGGTPGASNYEGTPGRGNGISHTLARRSIIAFPPPEAEFREGGKVTIRITVNKQGTIVSKQVVSASNSEIRAIALRKLDKIKFNKSDDAPEEQFGNITFVFKTRS